MTEQAVTFPSAGLKLSGVVHVPSGMRPGERRAAFLVLHGFGSNKTSSNTMQPTKVLGELGYVVLRFDMRGCGESEGEFGRVICLEQVEDTRSALTFLADHPAVDPERIGVIGHSLDIEKSTLSRNLKRLLALGHALEKHRRGAVDRSVDRAQMFARIATQMGDLGCGPRLAPLAHTIERSAAAICAACASVVCRMSITIASSGSSSAAN